MMEQITKESFERLKAKLETLKKKRAGISKTIGEAREHGDLRENSAYHSAKNEQGLNEMRIRELEEKLAHAEVVEKAVEKKKDTVTLGSRVRFKALDTKEEFEYTLVSEEEADILDKKISPASPIGGAILYAKLGEVVEAEIPRGQVKYKILKIK
jgi:transcription elongation factor GreA